jgi:hypothetical protein
MRLLGPSAPTTAPTTPETVRHFLSVSATCGYDNAAPAGGHSINPGQKSARLQKIQFLFDLLERCVLRANVSHVIKCCVCTVCPDADGRNTLRASSGRSGGHHATQVYADRRSHRCTCFVPPTTIFSVFGGFIASFHSISKHLCITSRFESPLPHQIDFTGSPLAVSNRRI